MDNASRMQRAKQLGFTVMAYHGTGANFDEFSLDVGKPNRGGGHGPNFTDVPGEASGYAKKTASGNVMPVLLRLKNPYVVNLHDKSISAKDFLAFTGGLKPYFWEGERWNYTTRDVMDSLFKHYNDVTGNNQKKTWEMVYAFFKEKGYDGFYFPETPRDHMGRETKNTVHKKIIVFDPKNVRSRFARFDPAQSDSANLSA